MFGKAGYETGKGGAADPDVDNLSELLLTRADGTGWDYVTALTPRGASFSAVALSTIAADRVTDGQLNPLTVHEISAPREGNTALANRIQTAFPQLNWKANNLGLVEVIPTSDGVRTATIANATSATRRVEVHADRSLCLADLKGVVEQCVDGTGATQNPSGATPTTSGSPAATSGDLTSLTNTELADLATRVSSEVTRRLTTGS